jgi:hypothetical protein
MKNRLILAAMAAAPLLAATPSFAQAGRTTLVEQAGRAMGLVHGYAEACKRPDLVAAIERQTAEMNEIAPLSTPEQIAFDQGYDAGLAQTAAAPAPTDEDCTKFAAEMAKPQQ